jgi:hypothetical protein
MVVVISLSFSTFPPGKHGFKLSIKNLVEAREAAIRRKRLSVESLPIYHDFLLIA